MVPFFSDTCHDSCGLLTVFDSDFIRDIALFIDIVIILTDLVKVFILYKQHDLTARIYVLHKITIGLKFMSYINQKLWPSYQTALNLCLT